MQAYLDAEKKIIKKLKQVYSQALKEVNKNISILSARADMNPPELKSIIYQQQYQQAIKGQLEGIIANLKSNEYATISDYLTRCYQNGYIGTMYDLQGQGIPLVMPINQKQVIKAIQIDSKLSKSLYDKLGENVNRLKKSIRADVSRGIANGSSWNEIALKLSKSMKHTPFEKAINNSIRIARTEGHRVQNSAALDAQYKAKGKGADIVKQWDASLDSRTRESHRKLDGQIREINEDFEVNGKTASAPGMFGEPAEDCNCRCTVLQRAKWALDESELNTLKERAEYFELDKTNDFSDYISKYLKANNVLNVPRINDVNIAKAQENFNGILKNSDGIESHVARMSLYSEFTEYIENDEIGVPFQYSVNEDVIFYNPKAPDYHLYDINYVQAHELSHRMDILEYKSYSKAEFLNAINVCRSRIMDNKQEIQLWFYEGGKYENDFAMSDIISALSLNEIEVPVGHGNDYWEKEDNVALEIFANISSIDIIGNNSRDEFKTMLKELYESYKEVVK